MSKTIVLFDDDKRQRRQAADLWRSRLPENEYSVFDSGDATIVKAIIATCNVAVLAVKICLGNNAGGHHQGVVDVVRAANERKIPCILYGDSDALRSAGELGLQAAQTFCLPLTATELKRFFNHQLFNCVKEIAA